MPPLPTLTEPQPMPVIVATLGGIKRLRRVEYRIVRTPNKTGLVKLAKFVKTP